MPLPPDLSGIYTPDFVRSLGEANRALAKLGELPHLLPNPDLLAAPLLRKEAVLSSKIEGTQTTLAELYKYEAKLEDKNIKKDDAKEVENYVKAMHRGMDDVKKLSLSLRTIKNMHEVLLAGVGRKDQGVPGQFRDFQAYIGPPGTPIEDATYVASPQQELNGLTGEFEKYLNNPDVIEDPIIQCGLIHYQLEAIHPFGDGNGRIGRLLIPIFFYARDIIGYPLVYISEYFEIDRQAYYDRLLMVSEKGDWKNWLLFFINGIKKQSEKTCNRGIEIVKLYKQVHEIVREKMQSSNSVALVEHIFKNPFTVAPILCEKLHISHATAMRLLEQFVDLGILNKSGAFIKRPGSSRPVKLYSFDSLTKIINK